MTENQVKQRCKETAVMGQGGGRFSQLPCKESGRGSP